MKYIEKVKLENFQSHKNTEIDFSPDLNIIVGESDSGKTAILRAIKWVLYNEPLGNSFIRKGESEAIVTIIFNDKTKISRIRSNSKNQYKLILPDGSENIYEGFGTGVPQEIIDITGIEKIELDKNESRIINLAEQLEGAFLLSEKDSVKASSIGRLVGVNIIDDALRQSLTDLRSLNKDKNKIIKNNKKLENEYKEYDYLVDLEVRLKKTKGILNKIKKRDKLKDSLKKISIKKEKTNLDKNEIKNKLNYLDEIEEVEILEEIISIKLIKLNQLIKMKDNLYRIKKETKVELGKKHKLEDLEDLNEKKRSLNFLIMKYNKILKVYKSNCDIELNKKNLNSILSKLNKLEDIELKSEHLSKKINKYIKIKKLYNKLNDTRKRINYGREYYSNFNEINRIDYDRMLEFQELLLKLYKLDVRKEKVLDKKEKLINNINNNNIRIKNLLKEYREILKNQDVCPLCLNKIDDKHIDNIIKEYMGEITL